MCGKLTRTGVDRNNDGQEFVVNVLPAGLSGGTFLGCALYSPRGLLQD